MLQEQAVPENLLATLKTLGPHLHDKGFYLAGGTALALRFGHRLSIDLDFFSSEPFSSEDLEAFFLSLNSEVKIINKTKGSLCLLMNSLKVELFHYPSKMLKPHDSIEHYGLLASVEDNAAMKLSALTNRGTKKDFVDTAELLNHFTLNELLDLYRTKYPQSNPLMLLNSLTYFHDAEEMEDPVFLKNQTWQNTKKVISKAVKALA